MFIIVMVPIETGNTLFTPRQQTERLLKSIVIT